MSLEDTPASFIPAIELFAFAAALTNAAEDTQTLLMPDHVVDHLGQEHRLADTGAAKQSTFATPLQRHQYIDRLDTRFEQLGSGGAFFEGRWIVMKIPPLDVRRFRLAVDGMSEHVEHRGK